MISMSTRCSQAGNICASERRCAISSMCLILPRWTTRSPTAPYSCLPGTPEPLALFRAARVDYSLHRLFHYTGTDPEHFQNFVIFTNYQFYIDAFATLAASTWRRATRPDAFVEPGNVIMRNARFGSNVASSLRASRRCRPFIWSSPAIEASR